MRNAFQLWPLLALAATAYTAHLIFHIIVKGFQTVVAGDTHYNVPSNAIEFREHLLRDTALITAFVIQHSLMASDLWKRLVGRYASDIITRPLYNLTSALTLQWIYSEWQPLFTSCLWKVHNHPLRPIFALALGDEGIKGSMESTYFRYASTVVYLKGLAICLGSLVIMDLLEVLGLRPALQSLTSKSAEPMASHTKAAVWHPMVLGPLLITLSMPNLTSDAAICCLLGLLYMALRSPITDQTMPKASQRLRSKLHRMQL
eukprot:Clim_evm13s230 gene=Clim_evmTU13s230